MPLPRGDIALRDKRQLTSSLLKCGATIREINIVRKHISALKGGWLAKKCYPATVLCLLLSDVVGDELETIASGPTFPDSTTFMCAQKVLKKYSLWESAPVSVRNFLLDGEKGIVEETPKEGDKAFNRVTNVVLGNNRDATIAVCGYLKSKGLNTVLLTSTLEGEAKHAGVVLASIGREVIASGNPAPIPAAIVAGGETTVTVVGDGIGGRSQELALSAALGLRGYHTTTIASLSTDGVDGPTDAAGAIADGETTERAESLGLDTENYLAANDSYTFFSKTGDLIFTGKTGTNVNDISLLIVL
jgi:glycerate-2-kinase